MNATQRSSEDIDLCSTMQKEEWEVLESIYPDYLSGDVSKGTITLEIPIEFSAARFVELAVAHGTCLAGFTSEVHPQHQQLSLSALPPVLLNITLPQDYPMNHPPQLLAVHATHSWLTRYNLDDKLRSMWHAGEGVLYNWIEWLRSGEFMEAIGMVDLGSSFIRISHPAPHLLAPVLTNYDTSQAAARFSQMSYACSVCLTSVKGARCILLSCSHVFCRECLEDFWKLCIAEGDVGRVGCPDPMCVKEGREADEEEVRRVVTDDEVARWRWLGEKRSLEKDPTILHCPVQVCQTPVRAPPADSGESGGWGRLRMCPSCGFSFCAFCRRTWHGPITECPMSVTDGFIAEYMALPESSPSRLLLERRYGRSNILRLVAKVEEERANLEWLENSTMACPFCHVHVEKSMGCNHMTCGKCKHHFCYRCGEKLDPTNPYSHFSTPGNRCYSKLFDYQPQDDGWQPVEGFAAL